MHYYYTRWLFKAIPDGLDSVGPYHSTFITDRSPEEFFNDLDPRNLKEFFMKQFDSKQEMEDYWNIFQ